MQLDNVRIDPILPLDGKLPTKFMGQHNQKVEVSYTLWGKEDTIGQEQEWHDIVRNRLLRSLQGRESLNSIQQEEYDKLVSLYQEYSTNPPKGVFAEYAVTTAVQVWIEQTSRNSALLLDWEYTLIMSKFLTDVHDIKLKLQPEYYEVNDPYYACMIVGDWGDILTVYQETVGDIDDMDSFECNIEGVSRATVLEKVAKSPREEGVEEPMGFAEAEIELQRLEELVYNRLIIGECVLIDGSLV